MLNPKYLTEIIENVELLYPIYKDKLAIYISAPITTGVNFINWHNTYLSIHKNMDKYEENKKKEIIDVNSQKILAFAENLRCMTDKPIIEPASLYYSHWTQADYLYYWQKIIENFVNEIIFMDGWTFSRGCVYEYYIGLKNNLKLVNQEQNIINKEKAIFAIQSSIKEYEASSIDSSFQRNVLNIIKEL